MKKILWAFALVFSFHASACLNNYEDEIAGLMYKGNPQAIAEAVERLERQYKDAPSAEVANDLAVAQVLAGKYARAIEVLERLEKTTPGLPKTAPNLGTALELAGRNAEALVWIKEGIRRDPNDHQGTEWLHVKILEAKLAIERDPDWLRSHTVLGVDFGDGAKPRIPSAMPLDHLGQSRGLKDIRMAISYQLGERLKFVEVPDPLVADLYMAWGDANSLLGGNSEREPLDLYQAAQRFGAMRSSALSWRIGWIELWQYLWMALLVIPLLAVLGIALWVLFRSLLWGIRKLR